MDALRELGVSGRSLTPEDRRSLDQRGFVAIPHILLPRFQADLRASFERLMKLEGKPPILKDLHNKGACYDLIYTHHKVLAAVHHLLQREFTLQALQARDGGHDAANAEGIVHALGMIDDFVPENGAPRVTLRSGETVLWTGEAGTVVIYDSRLAYADNPKQSERKRRSLYATFGVSRMKLAVSEETAARLPKAAHPLLGL
jgi:hypothetical protein